MAGKKTLSGSQNRKKTLLKHKKELNVVNKCKKNSKLVWRENFNS